MLPTSSTARLLDLSQLAGNGRHVSKFVAHTFTAALRTLMLQPHFPFDNHHPTTPPGGFTGRNFVVGAPWLSLVYIYKSLIAKFTKWCRKFMAESI